MKIINICIIIFCALFSSTVYSGSADYAVINKVDFMEPGIIVVYTDGLRTGAPACATQPNRFVVDGTTPSGKVLLNGLVLTYSLKKSVRFVGNNTCSVYGNTETITYFQTNN